MYDITLRYLCSAYVDAGSVTADPKLMTDLRDALGDESLETLTVGEKIGSEIKTRILLRRGDESWRLFIGSERFDVSGLGTKLNKGKVGSLNTFCKNAGATLNTCLKLFERKAHRLASVQEGFLREMPESELNGIAGRLFKMPTVFADQLPFEWDWRCASRIKRTFGRKTQETNTLATIKRVQGLIGNISDKDIQMDRIQINLDINTIADDTSPRFIDESVTGFFNKAGGWHKSFSQEIMDFIFDGDEHA